MLAGAGAVLLVVFLLAGPWAGSRSGWELLVSLRWLLALTIAAAFGLVLAQASRRAPAVPVTMSLLVTVLGAISALALIYRVLINPPAHQHAAAYLGLLSAIGLAYGGYLSMRKEGIADRDAPQDIPVVRPRRENGS
ncbi:MAG: hypothetical protein JO046_14290 [Solirubrobacterales bacterium]|nr:hypothetical protein [Solirubrobacterales bacterium]MBV9363319.1 hypothetical protein [Solirubrobacterales bacterium]MBV9682958.1 hypothetical protein [Solirubrobacterales bacterium]